MISLTTGRGLEFTSGAMNLRTSNSGTFGGSGSMLLGTVLIIIKVLKKTVFIDYVSIILITRYGQ